MAWWRRLSESFRIPRIAAAMLGCGIAVACDGGSSVPAKILTFSVADAGSHPQMVLSTSPNDVAMFHGGDALVQDLEIRGGDTDRLGSLADVATGPAGEMLLLDRLNHEVQIYDSNGTFLRAIGREGQGPGEFGDPIATAARDGVIAVLDVNPTKALTLFAQTGRIIDAGAGPGSDWQSVYSRGPSQHLNRPYQGGPEDWTRRIVALGDSLFAVAVRPDDRLVAGDADDGSATIGWLVRVGPRVAVMDTIRRLDVPRTELATDVVTDRGGRPIRESGSRRGEPIFASRPVFAAGAGWLALGHGARAGVVVENMAGDTTLAIEWPVGSRPITRDDARAGVMRDLEILMHSRPDGSFAAFWKRASDAERTAWLDRGVSLWSFPDDTPEVVAAYGDGACLWLAGFDPEASLDGTAGSLVAVRVSPPFAVATFRLPRRGLRLRHVSSSAVFASYRDDDDVDRVIRLRFSGLDCM